MWLLTTRGFYSVVADLDDPGGLLVRARVEDDLLALRDLLPAIDPWLDRAADYPWRAKVSREDWAPVVAALAAEIDYRNFKNAVADRQGRERAWIYSHVWEALRELETGPR